MGGGLRLREAVLLRARRPTARLDPLDLSTSRHAPQCEYQDATDPDTVRLILDVKDGLEPGYWWLECRACRTAWQVLHYAAESDG